MAPIPGGVDGNVASKDADTPDAYPARVGAYLCGRRGLTLAHMDSAGKQRVAMNEATFRKVNEGMQAGKDPEGLLTFVCECGRLGCNKLMRLTRSRYEQVRASSMTFAVIDGHELPEVEDVIDRGDGYVVVRKHDDAEAEIVQRTDPRRPIDD
jgi:hypothetical protein